MLVSKYIKIMFYDFIGRKIILEKFVMISLLILTLLVGL